MSFAPIPPLKNVAPVIRVQQWNSWHEFGWCTQMLFKSIFGGTSMNAPYAVHQVEYLRITDKASPKTINTFQHLNLLYSTSDTNLNQLPHYKDIRARIAIDKTLFTNKKLALCQRKETCDCSVLWLCPKSSLCALYFRYHNVIRLSWPRSWQRAPC